MKGVIEISWTLLITIISALIGFVIIFALIQAILSPAGITGFIYELCLLTLGKLGLFGLSGYDQGTCGPFNPTP